MTRLVEIQDHIASMGDLRDIVGAMRSLASMRVQESLQALPGARLYALHVAAAVASARRLLPWQVPAGGAAPRRAIILCLAEHGFVGGFNERIFEALVRLREPSDIFLALGSRGTALLHERGIAVGWNRPMPTRLSGVPDAADRLASEVYTLISGGVSRVEILFSRYRHGAASTVQHQVLVPLESSAQGTMAAQPPLHNLAPQRLLEKLVSEYIFARLTEAMIESLASENAARFAAMDSAHDNVDKKLDGLHQEERTARQSEVTAELLDLITGAEALRPASASHARIKPR